MIAEVTGSVRSVAPDGAIITVGGVGLCVLCTPATIARLRVGTEATLATVLVVREDSLTLYGFADADERAVFETLQTASGVGPKVAQAVLAVHRPDEVRRAVAAEDLVALMRVPGIGRKGAQRLVLELKDRLGSPLGSVPMAATAGWQQDVRTALIELGYAGREADEAVAGLPAPGDEKPDIAVLLRLALNALRRR